MTVVSGLHLDKRLHVAINRRRAWIPVFGLLPLEPDELRFAVYLVLPDFSNSPFRIPR
jgi:hypothetical protein